MPLDSLQNKNSYENHEAIAIIQESRNSIEKIKEQEEIKGETKEKLEKLKNRLINSLPSSLLTIFIEGKIKKAKKAISEFFEERSRKVDQGVLEKKEQAYERLLEILEKHLQHELDFFNPKKKEEYESRRKEVNKYMKKYYPNFWIEYEAIQKKFTETYPK